MKYLSSDPFTVPGPDAVMAGTCDACVWGKGEHKKECIKRTTEVEITLRDTRNGFQRTFRREFTGDYDLAAFWFEEGGGSCDCVLGDMLYPGETVPQGLNCTSDVIEIVDLRLIREATIDV